MTKRAGVQAALHHLERVHGHQRGWRSWLRVAWWLLLLPVALACWAAAQQSRPRQLVAWALAGLALLAWIGGVNGNSTSTTQTTASSVRVAPLVAAPRTAAATTSPATPSVEPTTMQPSEVPTSVATTVTAMPTSPPADEAAVTPPLPAPAPPVETQTTVAKTPITKTTTTAPLPAAQTFANCTALRVAYPHGVGMPGAVDHTSGSTKPVTTFTRSAALYEANAGSDRDGDQIACEQQ